MTLRSMLSFSTARGLAALVALAVAGACTGSLRAEAPAQAAGDADTLRSPFGDFLAARHAERTNDAARAAELFTSILTHSPDNPALMRQATNQLLATGRVAEAAAVAARYMKHEPESVLAGLTLAMAELAARKTGAAEERLAKLPMRGLGSYFIPLTLSWTKFARGNVDGALETLAPLAKLRGGQPFVDYHSALMLDLANQNERAAEHFEKLSADGFSGYVRFVEAAGGFWERRGETAKARDIYSEYLKRRPDAMPIEIAAASLGADGGKAARTVNDAYQGAAEALYNIATLLNQENVSDIAMMVLQLSLHLRPDFDPALVLQGDILAGMGRDVDAIAAYDRVSRTGPLGWPARLRAAQLLDRIGKGAVAYARLRDMAAEKPERSDALVTLGDLLRYQKRYAEAVEAYDAAFKRIGELQPRYWSLLYARGIALERSKKWDRAEADFLKALEFEPDQALVLNYLGYSWVEKGRHLDRALGMIEKAVRLRPSDGFIIDSLGWAHYQLKNFTRAVTFLERAVELTPQDPTINDHLGDAFWRVGRYYEARFQWSRALSLGPEPGEAPKIEKKLADGLPGAGVKREAAGSGRGRSGG